MLGSVGVFMHGYVVDGFHTVLIDVHMNYAATSGGDHRVPRGGDPTISCPVSCVAQFAGRAHNGKYVHCPAVESHGEVSLA
jgi:hypothetical protein